MTAGDTSSAIQSTTIEELNAISTRAAGESGAASAQVLQAAPDLSHRSKSPRRKSRPFCRRSKQPRPGSSMLQTALRSGEISCE